ncbi:MAG: hypothetical protein WCF20_05700 [Methylovirgula sp.]
MRRDLGRIDSRALIWTEDENSREADDRQLDQKHQHDFSDKPTPETVFRQAASA